MNVESIVKNLFKIGIVTAVDQDQRTVKVLFPDKDNATSDDLQVFRSAPFPTVGEEVGCLFLANGLEQGYCLGSFYQPVSGGGEQ